MKKLKNWHFSKGVDACFWSKNDHFFNFVFLGKIGHGNVFCDIVERKNAFLGYKKKKLKQSKNWHFSKGVNPWFWSKNGHFSNFVFSGNIGQANVLYDILEGKNAFLGYKNKKLKKAKNWHFFQRGEPMGLVQKWPFFQLCFFMQYRPGKCLLRYCRTKKRLSRL